MALDITNPGLSTTIQDRGRNGYYNVGIPQSGAMDRYSAELANALVGNDLGEGPGASVIECSYLGPAFTTNQDAIIAVTGGNVDVKVNGEPCRTWTRIELRAGDAVSFGPVRGGTRFYIGIQGGIDVPVVLGSRSTYVLGGIGGFEGRKLAAGDVLPVGEPTGPLPPTASVREEFRPEFTGPRTIRVLMGLYEHRLTVEGRAKLLTGAWKLTPVADRMGLRYDGPGVEWQQREQPFGAGSDPSNIVDAGYAVGSIQIPGGTQPIVLHRDAVSGGGYATVGTVITADMDLLARSAPGTVTHFQEVSMEEALAARHELAALLQQAFASLT